MSILLLPAVVIGSAVLGAQDPAAPEPTPVETLRAVAAALRPLVESDLARRFLEATADLPAIEHERVVYWDGTNRSALTPERARQLSEAELEAYREMTLGEQFYYYTAFGTPLAYSRVLDLAAAAGFASAGGKRIGDFGFGGIGHLRLLASLGADVMGIEVLELLRDFYREPGDTGVIPRSAAAGPGGDGSLTLLYGSFPGESGMVEEVTCSVQP